MIGFLTPLADAGISYSYGFVFVATNLAAALIVWFFLYESRMMSLENVDLMYGQPELKAWTSAKWVPPGYITREQRDETHFHNISVAEGATTEKRESDGSVDDSRHEQV